MMSHLSHDAHTLRRVSSFRHDDKCSSCRPDDYILADIRRRSFYRADVECRRLNAARQALFDARPVKIFISQIIEISMNNKRATGSIANGSNIARRRLGF